jgi:peptidoglycan-associated lipoprotein
MKINCDICGNELKVPGALLFTPPNKKGIVKKFHICVNCFKVAYKRGGKLRMKNLLLILALVTVFGCARKQVIKPTEVTTLITSPETQVVKHPIVNRNIITKVFFFDFDSAVLSSEYTETVWNESLKDCYVVISGYCDERGTEKYNKILGFRRANAVMDQLKKYGLIHVKVLSHGKRYAKHGIDDSIWSQDRKVIVKIVQHPSVQ